MIELIGYWVVFPIMAILVTKWMVRRAKTRIYKGLVLITCFAGFWELFWLHDTLAQWELKTICEKEGGIRVYKTVELPPEYFTPDGSPKFVKPNGDLDEAMLGGQYKYISESSDSYSHHFTQVSRFRDAIVDKRTNLVLAERRSFGGRTKGPPRPVPDGYPSCPESKFWDFKKFLSLVFKPSVRSN